MAYDIQTGQNHYSVDDILRMANLGVFGPKSNLVKSAIEQFKHLQQQHLRLLDEMNDLISKNNDLMTMVAGFSCINAEPMEIEEIN